MYKCYDSPSTIVTLSVQCWLLLFDELTVNILYDVSSCSGCVRSFWVHQETEVWIIQQRFHVCNRGHRREIIQQGQSCGTPAPLWVYYGADESNVDRDTKILDPVLHFATNPEKNIHESTLFFFLLFLKILKTIQTLTATRGPMQANDTTVMAVEQHYCLQPRERSTATRITLQ